MRSEQQIDCMSVVFLFYLALVRVTQKGREKSHSWRVAEHLLYLGFLSEGVGLATKKAKNNTIECGVA